MTNQKRLINRQALALFNCWLKSQQKDKRVGDLNIGDFLAICVFSKRLEVTNDTN